MATRTGELKKWHTLTFEHTSAASYTETSGTNPFLDRRLIMTFTGPSSQIYTVPGYFAADGNAAESSASTGDKWHCKFTPDEEGSWTYTTSFRSGTNIAIEYPVVPTTGSPLDFDADSGGFTILANDKTIPDFRAKGRLEYDGTRYPKFAETDERFIKVGADSPETFLAYDEFDNTSTAGSSLKDYTPHIADWQSGDPVWKTTLGKGIIGLFNYLESVGANSQAFIPMNVTGDGKNVWPWAATAHSAVDGTGTPDTTNRTFFDVSKLAQWGIVFDHAQSKGVMLNFKLQEQENDQLLDGGALGTERKLYFRELIARFSHGLAITWNIGEENTNTESQRIEFLQYFSDTDPYNHLRVMHTFPTGKSNYTALLGANSELTGLSLQSAPQGSATSYDVKDDVDTWLGNSISAGKPWAIANDEQTPDTTGAAADANYTAYNGRGSIADNRDNIRKNILWAVLMGGGFGVEYYYGYQTGTTDLNAQDHRSRANKWTDGKIAIDFFKTFAFYDMTPDDNIITGSNWGMKNEGTQYLVFLPNGGTANITTTGTRDYNIQWFDSRNGGALQTGSLPTLSPGVSSIGTAPNSTTSDWAVLITVQSNELPILTLNTIKSFPTAVGGGAKSQGGRGLKRCFVNTLNLTTGLTYDAGGDYYRGGFQAALTNSNIGYIIFDISGYINIGVGGTGSLGSWPTRDGTGIPVKRKTILGQLAPRGGITLTGGGFRIGSFNSKTEGGDLIFRHFRSRPLLDKTGVNNVGADDQYTWAFQFNGGDNIIVDHCSGSFDYDKTIGAWIREQHVPSNGGNGSMYGYTFSYGLYGDGATGMYIEINPNREGNPEELVDEISWIKNVAVAVNRTPNMAFDGYGEVINNVIYDTPTKNIRSYHDIKLNHVANYYRRENTSRFWTGTNESNNFGLYPWNQASWPDVPVNYSRENIFIGPVNGGVAYTSPNFTLTGDPSEDNGILWISDEGDAAANPANLTTTPHTPPGTMTYAYYPIRNTAQESYDELITNRNVGANRYVDNNGVPGIYQDDLDTIFLDAIENNTNYTSKQIGNWVLPTLPANSRSGYDSIIRGISDNFVNAHNISAWNEVKTNWNFGTYTLNNSAGYNALEIYSFWVADDFDTLINQGNVPGDSSYTVSTGDTLAPVIIQTTISNIKDTTFQIDWDLNEPSKAQIQYGTATGIYTQYSVLDNSFLTSHMQTLGKDSSALRQNTTYYWRIRTEDAAGNVGYSAEQSTTTITLLNNNTPNSFGGSTLNNAYIGSIDVID